MSTKTKTDEMADVINRMPRCYRGVIRKMMTPEFVSSARKIKRMVDEGELDRKTVLAIFERH